MITINITASQISNTGIGKIEFDVPNSCPSYMGMLTSRLDSPQWKILTRILEIGTSHLNYYSGEINYTINLEQPLDYSI